jgi:hypothetical protein
MALPRGVLVVEDMPIAAMADRDHLNPTSLHHLL